MTDPAATAARAAAVILAPDLGPGLAAQVEAALASAGSGGSGPASTTPPPSPASACPPPPSSSLPPRLAQAIWAEHRQPVGLTPHHANPPILIEGDLLPVRLPRSRTPKAAS